MPTGNGLAAEELLAAKASTAEALIEELLERAGFYRLLAGLYFAPLTQEQVDAMDAEAFRELAATCDDALAAEGYNDMYRALRRRDTGTRQALNVDFTGAFYGVQTYEGLTAAPYESLFTCKDGTLMGPARAAVLATYSAHGIELQKGVDLPDDHLSFELEFLAVLNERCAQKLAGCDAAGALADLASQRAFVQAHVLNWFNRLFNLSNKLLKTRFYRGVNKVAKAFLQAEPAAIDELERRVRDQGRTPSEETPA